jgi:hypothetical protein
MITKTSKPRSIPNSDAELVSILMPRPLHDAVDYPYALSVLDMMAGFQMNADQEDYFDAVATFVERYESEHQVIVAIIADRQESHVVKSRAATAPGRCPVFFE